MSVLGDLWPYVVLVLVGFLPNEIWRWLGVVAAHRAGEQSEFLTWARAVATAVLAGVVAKIIFFAPGALASVPLAVRLAATVVAVIAYLLIRRSIFAGVLCGSIALVLGGLVLAP
ncbi:MAG: AzlD domain-containing protein [Proteobacteria bacterium]|nr:AzlD domain-containing protein [Pseudomonadota bacterium]